eukprot:353222-Chlamydomonas_euryale.AAC.3
MHVLCTDHPASVSHKGKRSGPLMHTLHACVHALMRACEYACARRGTGTQHEPTLGLLFDSSLAHLAGMQANAFGTPCWDAGKRMQHSVVFVLGGPANASVPPTSLAFPVEHFAFVVLDLPWRSLPEGSRGG